MKLTPQEEKRYPNINRPQWFLSYFPKALVLIQMFFLLKTCRHIQRCCGKERWITELKVKFEPSSLIPLILQMGKLEAERGDMIWLTVSGRENTKTQFLDSDRCSFTLSPTKTQFIAIGRKRAPQRHLIVTTQGFPLVWPPGLFPIVIYRKYWVALAHSFLLSSLNCILFPWGTIPCGSSGLKNHCVGIR